jgi:predicted lipoprotein with Yx(FWY)xxD motif
MKTLRAQGLVRMTGVALVAIALVASACGKSNSPTSGGGGSTSNGGGGTTSGGGSGSATVEAKSIGSLGMVLVDSKGFTLYHLTGETPAKLMCTAACVQAWPPLKASGSPTGGSGATGTLSTAMRSDGISQVTYDGLLLYTFSGDTQPGQANGQGIEGKWFAVTPAGKSAGSGGGSTTGGSTSGGRYGGY